ncbi:hypothetical protein [Streptomyces sp. NPDC096030]|uniref:hypothetical protein n=1 Tax=Streptomyces sp. NPDC096030 TaxID=3155423 RepID=UPI00331B5A6F
MPTEPVIDRETARHVLWMYGHEGGLQPGVFTQRMFGAISAASIQSKRKLANEFPELVAAIDLACLDPEGIAKLQQIASGQVAA